MKKTLLLICCILIFVPLSAEITVLAFAGSTREDSYNKKLVREAADIARQMGAIVTLIDLKEYPMPLYDGDLEKKEGLPKYGKQLRHLMIHSDAIIIASPEYNGSISGVLKNTLDWVSRSESGSFSASAFEGKKFALMSASPGKGGGARGLIHLRAIIEDLGGIVMQKTVSIPHAQKVFSEKQKAENLFLKEEMQQLMSP